MDKEKKDLNKASGKVWQLSTHTKYRPLTSVFDQRTCHMQLRPCSDCFKFQIFSIFRLNLDGISGSLNSRKQVKKKQYSPCMEVDSAVNPV